MNWQEGYLKRNEERFREMRIYVRKHKRIVDFGIGGGGYYRGESFRKAIGIDSDKGMLHRAAKFHEGLRLIHGDILEVPLPDKQFDLVVLSHILEHFKNYQPIIDKAKRVCQDNGYFLIGLPIESYIKVHFYPVWTEGDVRELAKKFGTLIALHKTTDSWIMYVKKT